MPGYIGQPEGRMLGFDEIERNREEYQDRMASKRKADLERMQSAKSFNPGQTGLAATQITPGSDAQKQLIAERAKQSLSSWGAKGNAMWNGWEAPAAPAQPGQQKPADFYDDLINRLGPDMVRQGINMLGAYAPWMFR